MTEIGDLNDAIAHITDCTGDPDAWRRGLAPTELAVLLPAAVIDPRELSGLLDKVRADHQLLFDPRTGKPSTPPSVPPPGPPSSGGQQGEAATAMRKAEDDLAQQNSSTAQLDLHVITAILNAHTTTVEGNAALRELQRAIEDAVRARTDLDAPAGARDFQRFLIGKLREIGAVVETASLDDTSKAALASAWSALYEAAKGSPAGSAAPAAADRPPADARELPPYGEDTAADPLFDRLLADEPGWPADPYSESGPAAAPAPLTAPPTQPALAPLLPAAPPSLPGLGAGVPGGLALPRADDGLGPSEPASSALDDRALDELLGWPEEPDPTGDEAGDDELTALDDSAPDAASADPAPESGPTLVRLPNGDTVTAPNPQIANAMKAAIAGTPLGDAFRQQGIAIPPPGTAVAHPIDPARLGTGDIGMFTDRQALALDRNRALLDGEIQPVASVSGPSFLGWQHPPGPGNTTPSASSPATPPNNIATPPPTRPATAVGHPR